MPPRLPKISDFAVDAVVKWLMERENMLRPPEATARFLVFCVMLQDLGMNFPPRADAATHLGCSVALIDTALSQRLATGHISLKIEVEDGNVKRRLSTIRRRVITVSDEIAQVVHEAQRKSSRRRSARRAAEPNNDPNNNSSGKLNAVVILLAAGLAMGLSYPGCLHILQGEPCEGHYASDMPQDGARRLPA